MENLIKGWVFSLIGLLSMIGVFVHWTGIYHFPNPNFLNNDWECALGLIVSFILFSLPKTKIDQALEQALSSLTEKFKNKNQA